jgi:hypothetical protein
MAAINAIVTGAYATIIQLEGGAVTTLAKYRQSGSSTPITGVMLGANQPLIQNDAGQIVSLVDHLRSTGGQLIEKTVTGGYQALVISGGTTKDLTKYQQEEETALLSVAAAKELAVGELEEVVVLDYQQ